jgi:hypothetical protein
VPIFAEAGNTSQPGPGPNGTPPGPCAVLGSVDVAPPTSAGLNCDSIFPWTNLRGVRSGPEFCASAQMLSETPIAAAVVPLEILRSFEVIQLMVRFSCSKTLDLRSCATMCCDPTGSVYSFVYLSGKVTEICRTSGGRFNLISFDLIAGDVKKVE